MMFPGASLSRNWFTDRPRFLKFRDHFSNRARSNCAVLDHLGYRLWTAIEEDTFVPGVNQAARHIGAHAP
jgi:hypothetical protein